eukprot:778854-Rhodomonas_salina.2
MMLSLCPYDGPTPCLRMLLPANWCPGPRVFEFLLPRRMALAAYALSGTGIAYATRVPGTDRAHVTLLLPARGPRVCSA